MVAKELEISTSWNVNVSVLQCRAKKDWHRRYGHLGEQSLAKLAKGARIKCFDYDSSNEIGFCETCIDGKH